MAYHFILEHRSKGPYTGLDRDKGGDLIPTFKHSIARNDFEVRQFTSRPEAERELAKVGRTVPGCYIVPVKGQG